MYEIRQPEWRGGKPHVGIASFRIAQEGNFKLKITYRRKDGSESFPGYYEMPNSKLRSYPTEKLRGGVIVHVSPLEDWTWKPPEL